MNGLSKLICIGMLFSFLGIESDGSVIHYRRISMLVTDICRKTGGTVALSVDNTYSAGYVSAGVGV